MAWAQDLNTGTKYIYMIYPNNVFKLIHYLKYTGNSVKKTQKTTVELIFLYHSQKIIADKS